MAISKLGIYNNALRLVGETPLDALTDDVESRYDLDSVYDLGSGDYCLEVVKPRFATKTTSLTGVATAGGITLAYTQTLPTDFITIVAVYSDAELDQQVSRYIQEGSTILCDYETVFLRYTHNTVTETDYTPGFARVVSHYMAREIAYKYDPDRYDSIDSALQEIIETVITTEGEKEPVLRPSVQGSALTSEWRTIYNGALMILGQDKLPAGNTDHPNRVKLDTSVAEGAVSTVMEDTEWQFGITSVKIEQDISVAPLWGHPYAIEKPSDVQRIAGLFIDEYMQVPLKDYKDEGTYFFCNYTEIYFKYVTTSFIVTPADWPQYFLRLVSAQLAKDTAPGIAPALIDHANQTYEDRKSKAMSNDAQQSPPRILANGSWLRSRFNNYGRGRP